MSGCLVGDHPREDIEEHPVTRELQCQNCGKRVYGVNRFVTDVEWVNNRPVGTRMAMSK